MCQMGSSSIWRWIHLAHLQLQVFQITCLIFECICGRVKSVTWSSKNARRRKNLRKFTLKHATYTLAWLLDLMCAKWPKARRGTPFFALFELAHISNFIHPASKHKLLYGSSTLRQIPLHSTKHLQFSACAVGNMGNFLPDSRDEELSAPFQLMSK